MASTNDSISTKFFLTPETTFGTIAETLDALELLKEVILSYDGQDVPGRVASGAYTVLRNLQRELNEVLDSYTMGTPDRLRDLLRKGVGGHE